MSPDFIATQQAQSRSEGVAREENLPFLWQPRQPAQAGVILVHGFTATPWEMRLLGEAVVAAGYTAFGVRLPGHGTTPEDLAVRRYEEWLTAVEDGIAALARRGLRIYGIGQSTGSLLLLAAAAAGRPLSGLILLSPYLRLRHRLAPAAGLLRFLQRFQSHSLPEELAPFYYDRRPVNGVYQIVRLLRQVRRRLANVDLPALVVGAQGDRTIEVASLYELFVKLPGRNKECHFFGPDTPHVLTTRENPHWRRTRQLTLDFLRTLEGGHAPGGDRVP